MRTPQKVIDLGLRVILRRSIGAHHRLDSFDPGSAENRAFHPIARENLPIRIQ